MSHLSDCHKEIQAFCTQPDKALTEIGSEPRDQESILDSQNNEFEMGNNENKVDNNKDVDKHTQQTTLEQTVLVMALQITDSYGTTSVFVE